MTTHTHTYTYIQTNHIAEKGSCNCKDSTQVGKMLAKTFDFDRPTAGFFCQLCTWTKINDRGVGLRVAVCMLPITVQVLAVVFLVGLRGGLVSHVSTSGRHIDRTRQNLGFR